MSKVSVYNHILYCLLEAYKIILILLQFQLIRASLDQLTTLADFMENHPALAQGTMKSLEGRNTAKRLYHQLSLSLNALNGVKKSPRGWARVNV